MEKTQIKINPVKPKTSDISKMSAKLSTKQSDTKEGINLKSNDHFTGHTPNASQKSSKATESIQEKHSSKTNKKVSTTEKISGSKTSAAVLDQIKSPRSSKDDSDQPRGEIIEELQLIEKSIYVGLFKKYYYIKHQSNDEPPIDDRKFYSLQKAKDYISEGANFLLHRYLARTIYIGSFELSTMYINGDMCRNIYNCTGPESKLINDRRIDICTIYRTIIEECGIEHRCTTILTLKGQIVNQIWEGTNYLLQINPLLDVDNYKIVGNEEILLKHAWESDMQLMSKYLDEKVANEIKIKSYMIDHPEFRNMITDYIHTILLLKPEDIIDFTISHFLSFAPQFLPQNDYF
ncbi:riia domain-containing protein 1 [Holotrichia oblita]|uniref:Riia domain-containing protein 1 n=1 Tax=Holotrichia oblita TaxID=644536 RepID=A0ACB9SHP7_HOLOL|nr:riia domain-containing protein 1 [Holotrichia oblita]